MPYINKRGSAKFADCEGRVSIVDWPLEMRAEAKLQMVAFFNFQSPGIFPKVSLSI